MEIKRFLNATSTYSLDDLSSILIDLQIAEFIATIIHSDHNEGEDKEVLV